MKRLLYICLSVIVGSCMHSYADKKSHHDVVSTIDSALCVYFYMEGEKQLALNNYEAAFALVREAARLNPGSLPAKYALARIYVKMNKVDTALALMRQVADGDTTHILHNIGYANIATHQHKFDEARRVLERIIRNHRNKPEVYNPLARIYTYQKEYGKALACYDSLETYMGNSPELAAERVSLYVLMGDTATAVSIAENLVKETPTDVYRLLYLSDVYRYFGRYPQQMEVLNKAATITPDEPIIYISQADYHISQGDTMAYHAEYEKLLRNANIDYEVKQEVMSEYVRTMAQAENFEAIYDMYDTFISLYPYESELRKEYTSILIYMQQYAEAIVQLNILTEQIEDGAVWEQLLISHYHLNQFPAAMTAAHKALEMGRKTFVIYMYMNYIYIMEKSYDKALESLRQTLEVCDESKNAERSYVYSSMGDIYNELNMPDKCFQHYDTALVYKPDNAMTLNNYAYNLACSNGDLLKAEKMSATAVKLDPDNKTFIDTHAWVLFKMGSYTLARIYMEQAVKQLSPEDTDVEVYYEHYGDILFMSGETEAAIEQWQKAYKTTPTDILKKKIEQKQYIEE